MGNMFRRFTAFMLGVIFTVTTLVGSVVGGAYWAYKNVKPLELVEAIDEETVGDLKQMTIEEIVDLVYKASQAPDEYTFARFEDEYGIKFDEILKKLGINIEADADGDGVPDENWEAFKNVSLLSILSGDDGVNKMLDSIKLRALYVFVPDNILGEVVLSPEAQAKLGDYTVAELIAKDDMTGELGIMTALKGLKLGSLLPLAYESTYDVDTHQYTYTLDPDSPLGSLTFLDLLGNVELKAVVDILDGGDVMEQVIDGGLSSVTEMTIADVLTTLAGTAGEKVAEIVGDYARVFGDTTIQDLFVKQEDGSYAFDYTELVSNLEVGYLLGMEKGDDGVWYSDDEMLEEASGLLGFIADFNLGDVLENKDDVMSMVTAIVGDLSVETIYSTFVKPDEEGNYPALIEALGKITVADILEGGTENIVENVKENLLYALDGVTLADAVYDFLPENVKTTIEDIAIVDALMTIELTDLIQDEYTLDSVITVIEDAIGEVTIGEILGVEKNEDGTWVSDNPVMNVLYDYEVGNVLEMVKNIGDVTAMAEAALGDITFGDIYSIAFGYTYDETAGNWGKDGEYVAPEFGKFLNVKIANLIKTFDPENDYTIVDEIGDLDVGDVAYSLLQTFGIEDIIVEDGGEYVADGDLKNLSSVVLSVSVNDIVNNVTDTDWLMDKFGAIRLGDAFAIAVNSVDAIPVTATFDSVTGKWVTDGEFSEITGSLFNVTVGQIIDPGEDGYAGLVKSVFGDVKVDDLVGKYLPDDIKENNFIEAVLAVDVNTVFGIISPAEDETTLGNVAAVFEPYDVTFGDIVDLTGVTLPENNVIKAVAETEIADVVTAIDGGTDAIVDFVLDSYGDLNVNDILSGFVTYDGGNAFVTTAMETSVNDVYNMVTGGLDEVYNYFETNYDGITLEDVVSAFGVATPENAALAAALTLDIGKTVKAVDTMADEDLQYLIDYATTVFENCSPLTQGIVAGVAAAAGITVYFVANDTLVEAVTSVFGEDATWYEVLTDTLGADTLGYTVKGDEYWNGEIYNSLMDVMLHENVAETLTTGYPFFDTVKYELTLGNLLTAHQAEIDALESFAGFEIGYHDGAVVIEGYLDRFSGKVFSVSVGEVLDAEDAGEYFLDVFGDILVGDVFAFVSNNVEAFENECHYDSAKDGYVCTGDFANVLDKVYNLSVSDIYDAVTGDFAATMLDVFGDVAVGDVAEPIVEKFASDFNDNDFVTATYEMTVEEIYDLFGEDATYAIDYFADIYAGVTLGDVVALATEEDFGNEVIATAYGIDLGELLTNISKDVKGEGENNTVEFIKETFKDTTIGDALSGYADYDGDNKFVEATYSISVQKVLDCIEDLTVEGICGELAEVYYGVTIYDVVGLFGLDDVDVASIDSLLNTDIGKVLNAVATGEYDYLAEVATEAFENLGDTTQLVVIGTAAAAGTVLYFVDNALLVDVATAVFGEDETWGELLAESLGYTLNGANYENERFYNPLVDGLFKETIVETLTAGYPFVDNFAEVVTLGNILTAYDLVYENVEDFIGEDILADDGVIYLGGYYEPLTQTVFNISLADILDAEDPVEFIEDNFGDNRVGDVLAVILANIEPVGVTATVSGGYWTTSGNATEFYDILYNITVSEILTAIEDNDAQPIIDKFNGVSAEDVLEGYYDYDGDNAFITDTLGVTVENIFNMIEAETLKDALTELASVYATSTIGDIPALFGVDTFGNEVLEDVYAVEIAELLLAIADGADSTIDFVEETFDGVTVGQVLSGFVTYDGDNEFIQASMNVVIVDTVKEIVNGNYKAVCADLATVYDGVTVYDLLENFGLGEVENESLDTGLNTDLGKVLNAVATEDYTYVENVAIDVFNALPETVQYAVIGAVAAAGVAVYFIDNETLVSVATEVFGEDATWGDILAETLGYEVVAGGEGNTTLAAGDETVTYKNARFYNALMNKFFNANIVETLTTGYPFVATFDEVITIGNVLTAYDALYEALEDAIGLDIVATSDGVAIDGYLLPLTETVLNVSLESVLEMTDVETFFKTTFGDNKVGDVLAVIFANVEPIGVDATVSGGTWTVTGNSVEFFTALFNVSVEEIWTAVEENDYQTIIDKFAPLSVEDIAQGYYDYDGDNAFIKADFAVTVQDVLDLVGAESLNDVLTVFQGIYEDVTVNDVLTSVYTGEIFNNAALESILGLGIDDILGAVIAGNVADFFRAELGNITVADVLEGIYDYDGDNAFINDTFGVCVEDVIKAAGITNVNDAFDILADIYDETSIGDIVSLAYDAETLGNNAIDTVLAVELSDVFTAVADGNVVDFVKDTFAEVSVEDVLSGFVTYDGDNEFVKDSLALDVQNVLDFVEAESLEDVWNEVASIYEGTTIGDIVSLVYDAETLGNNAIDTVLAVELSDVFTAVADGNVVDFVKDTFAEVSVEDVLSGFVTYDGNNEFVKDSLALDVQNVLDLIGAESLEDVLNEVAGIYAGTTIGDIVSLAYDAETLGNNAIDTVLAVELSDVFTAVADGNVVDFIKETFAEVSVEDVLSGFVTYTGDNEFVEASLALDVNDVITMATAETWQDAVAVVADLYDGVTVYDVLDLAGVTSVENEGIDALLNVDFGQALDCVVANDYTYLTDTLTEAFDKCGTPIQVGLIAGAGAVAAGFYFIDNETLCTIVENVLGADATWGSVIGSALGYTETAGVYTNGEVTNSLMAKFLGENIINTLSDGYDFVENYAHLVTLGNLLTVHTQEIQAIEGLIGAEFVDTANGVAIDGYLTRITDVVLNVSVGDFTDAGNDFEQFTYNVAKDVLLGDVFSVVINNVEAIGDKIVYNEATGAYEVVNGDKIVELLENVCNVTVEELVNVIKNADVDTVIGWLGNTTIADLANVVSTEWQANSLLATVFTLKVVDIIDVVKGEKSVEALIGSFTLDALVGGILQEINAEVYNKPFVQSAMTLTVSDVFALRNKMAIKSIVLNTFGDNLIGDAVDVFTTVDVDADGNYAMTVEYVGPVVNAILNTPVNAFSGSLKQGLLNCISGLTLGDVIAEFVTEKLVGAGVTVTATKTELGAWTVTGGMKTILEMVYNTSLEEVLRHGDDKAFIRSFLTLDVGDYVGDYLNATFASDPASNMAFTKVGTAWTAEGDYAAVLTVVLNTALDQLLQNVTKKEFLFGDDFLGNVRVGEIALDKGKGVYDEVAGTWTNGDGSAVTFASPAEEALLGKVYALKLKDIVNDFDVVALLDGIYVGSLLGYTENSGNWFETKDAYTFDGVDYTYSAETAVELTGLYKVLAELELSSLMDGSFSVDSLLNSLKLGDLLGFITNGTVWYNTATYGTPEYVVVDTDGMLVAGEEAAKLAATVADIEISTLLGGNGFDTLMDTLFGLQLGYVFSYYTDEVVVGTETLGGETVNVYNWYTDAEMLTPATGINAKLANYTIEQVQNNMADIINDWTLSDVMNAAAFAGNAVLEAVKDTKIGQLAADINGMKIGAIMGKTLGADITGVTLDTDGNAIVATKWYAYDSVAGTAEYNDLINLICDYTVAGIASADLMSDIMGVKVTAVFSNVGTTSANSFEKLIDPNWTLGQIATEMPAKLTTCTVSEYIEIGIFGTYFDTQANKDKVSLLFATKSVQAEHPEYDDTQVAAAVAGMTTAEKEALWVNLGISDFMAALLP